MSQPITNLRPRSACVQSGRASVTAASISALVKTWRPLPAIACFQVCAYSRNELDHRSRWSTNDGS
jgi:hypothetical protein